MTPFGKRNLTDAGQSSRLWLPHRGSPGTTTKRKLTLLPAFADGQFGEQITAAMSAASLWIRKRRDSRVEQPNELATAILDRIALQGGAARTAPRVVVVVAHPDDEAIGAGAVLRGLPDATVVHVTDGAPGDDEYA